LKFPGSKLLHHWDLSVQKLPLDDLLRSCQQAGLTGFAEIKLPDAVAMIFYYVGGEVNALYREGAVAFSGQAALDRLRADSDRREGQVSVYELPIDMAHLLRGITNRQKLKETLQDRADLVELLHRMEKAEHTGTLEIQKPSGAAMLLLVRGRLSNTYWESAAGSTFEKREARQKLDEALDQPGETQVYLSDFSRDVWKSRHEVQDSVRSRLQPRDPHVATPAEQLVTEEQALRNQVLEELCSQLPAVAQAFLFDLMTGSILARRGGKGGGLKVGLLADKVPNFTLFLRDLVAAEDEDQVELIEVSTERMAVMVGIVPEAQEGIALMCEKSQPTALLGANLARAIRGYAARLAPIRPADLAL
jgi:hypothetical protein